MSSTSYGAAPGDGRSNRSVTAERGCLSRSGNKWGKMSKLAQALAHSDALRLRQPRSAASAVTDR